MKPAARPARPTRAASAPGRRRRRTRLRRRPSRAGRRGRRVEGRLDSDGSAARRRGGAKMAKTCIGLDLGSSSVKMAQLLRGRGGDVKLLAFGIEPIAPDAIVDGTIMNQSAVVDAVQALSARLKPKDRQVALAISGHSVIIKKILVPSMND